MIKNKKERNPMALWLKWVLCLTPALLGFLLYFLLPYFPYFTEYVFAQGIYRVVAFPLEWIMSLIPFSLTEIVVILAVPAIITLIVIFIRRLIKSENKGKTAEKAARFVCWCLSAAFLMFMITDGANFSRLSVAELMELPDGNYTKEDLYTLTVDLAQKASAVREELPEDEDGCADLTVSVRDLFFLADDCFDNLTDEYPFFVTGVWRVKPVMLSHLWSYTGYTGVYCPWLLESSVNVDTPVFDIAHTATHEIAHTMAFARENECNFLSWLACSHSGQIDFEYSGYIQAYIYSANALYKADKELWAKAFSNCSEAMVRDLEKHNAYWASFEGEVMDKSQDFNDSFIKANGDNNGVLSYDLMVELLLRYYDKMGMLG